jgi:nucleotide-binding universal stress UspA family protein
MDFMLGSVAQKIIRSALCPVMTVRYLPASDGVRSPA